MTCPIPAMRIPPDELDRLGVEAANGDSAAEGRAVSGVAAMTWVLVINRLAYLGATRRAILLDVFSDVLQDVLGAVRNYQHERGARLSTFVRNCVTNAITKRVRANLARLNRHRTLDTNAAIGAGGNHDHIDDRLDRSRTAAMRWRIMELIATLPPIEQEVLRRRYGLFGSEPETLREIGESMRLSGERIRQIEGDALYRLGAREAPITQHGWPRP